MSIPFRNNGMNDPVPNDNGCGCGPGRASLLRTRGWKICIAVAVLALLAGGLSVFLSCCVLRKGAERVPLLPGAEVARGAPTMVRVLLAEGAQELSVGSASGGTFKPMEAGHEGQFPAGKGPWRVRPGAGGLRVGERLLRASRTVFSSDKGSFQLQERTYRGELILEAGENGLTAINSVQLEDYLRSVVASEMPSDWPLDALMAQAVAARTYALYRLQQTKDNRWDFRPIHLAYGGVSAEFAAADRAVKLTEGVVMTFEGALFCAYFSNTCGGHTASGQKVFGEPPLPPLSGVECDWCSDSPVYRWKEVITAARLAQLLRPWGVGQVKSIQTLGTEPDGWASFVMVNGNKKIRANRFRGAVGGDSLKSVAFTVKKQDDTFLFEGRGWGHGIGLCQWGARGQAAAGRSWWEILSYYYPGIRLQKVH